MLKIALKRIILICLCGLAITNEILQVRAYDKDSTNEAIKRLWSSDEGERARGKRELLEGGQSSIKPLMALLTDIESNLSPRYVTGKEKEGRESAKQLSETYPTGNERKIRKYLEEYTKIEITARLRNDIIELLGYLQAQEAIPLLMDIIIKEPRRNLSKEYWDVTMKALVQIGHPVVTHLTRINHDLRTVVLSVNPKIQRLPEKTRESFIEFEVNKIRTRSAMILGCIGEVQSLPGLEQQLNGAKDFLLIYYTKEAISKIKQGTDCNFNH
jgi:hypothetical protein